MFIRSIYLENFSIFIEGVFYIIFCGYVPSAYYVFLKPTSFSAFLSNQFLKSSISLLILTLS